MIFPKVAFSFVNAICAWLCQDIFKAISKFKSGRKSEQLYLKFFLAPVHSGSTLQIMTKNFHVVLHTILTAHTTHAFTFSVEHYKCRNYAKMWTKYIERIL